MITALIYVLIVALILWIIYYALSQFISGPPLNIVGIILGLILLLYVLTVFKLLPPLGAVLLVMEKLLLE